MGGPGDSPKLWWLEAICAILYHELWNCGFLGTIPSGPLILIRLIAELWQGSLTGPSLFGGVELL